MERPIYDLPERLPHDSADEDESVVSNCESGVSSGHVSERFVREAKGVGFDLIGSRFVGGLGSHGLKAGGVLIHCRNACSTMMAQVRVQSFQIFARAVAKLRDENANLKHAWYGASSKEEKTIAQIIQQCKKNSEFTSTTRNDSLTENLCPTLVTMTRSSVYICCLFFG